MSDQLIFYFEKKTDNLIQQKKSDPEEILIVNEYFKTNNLFWYSIEIKRWMAIRYN